MRRLDAEHRLLALDQDQAWGLYRDLRNVLFFVLVVAFLVLELLLSKLLYRLRIRKRPY